MTKKGVIIGINKYHDDRFRELKGAEADAEEIHARLVQNGGFDIPTEDRLIGPDATARGIRERISDLLWRTDKADIALVYFSGHGVADEYGNGYLAPWDMQYDRPFVNGIRLQELKDLMKSAVNKDSVVFIFDSCYSGIAADGKAGGAEAPALDDMFAIEENLEGKGRIVLASSGPDEKSRERADCIHQMAAGEPHTHGYFTYQLLEGLDGRAATSADQEVSLKALHEYVERELRKETRKQTLTFAGYGIQNSDQIFLSTASKHALIKDQLTAVEAALEEGSSEQHWYAIYQLKKIVSDAPNLGEARALAQRVDERLDDERQTATSGLGGLRISLLGYPRTLARLDRLVLHGHFEQLCGETERTLGLLHVLWKLSLAGGNEEDFVSMVSANETRLNKKQRSVPEPGQRTGNK